MEDLFNKSEEELTNQLTRFWRTDKLAFVGVLEVSLSPDEIGYGYISKPVLNDRTIYYPKPVVKRIVSIRVTLSPDLVAGDYYKVYAKLGWLELRKAKDNPFLLVQDETMPLEQILGHVTPKAFIQKWFYEKGATPGDASTIAGQLKLNELELYTHTKRFIFELIQNADDMPLGKKPVEIELLLLNNFLLFLHNGKFFDREDVKAICDAAKSTKVGHVNQTGYKGIGFKSVFTDSYRVYIKSGDYTFKFDKLEPIFHDFHLLYKGYFDKLSTDAQHEFLMEFEGREDEYTNINKIPWQIKPIWFEKEDIADELYYSIFMKPYSVSIALEIGEELILQKQYHEMISALLREPRFLLFLRNTTKFSYNQLQVGSAMVALNVSLQKDKSQIKITQDEDEIAAYIKRDYAISIQNSEFLRAGLNFERKELEGGKIEFYDREGKKLDNIPEKLAHLHETTITFAAKVNGNSILVLNNDESILFNYLPTSDQRFGFPFLVNADFVSKSDREFIQIENKWNHYIFYQIGLKCIDWLSYLGNITQPYQNGVYHPYAKTYLNLLPSSLLDQNNAELSSINTSFNNGLSVAIDEKAFIIDSNGSLKKCSEIILDETRISKILGIPFFKFLSKTSKELPIKDINEAILRKQYLAIEHYCATDFITHLIIESNRVQLAITLQKISPQKYNAFLKWLDSFCQRNDVDKAWLISLPLIRVKSEVLTLTEALNYDTLHIKTIETKSIENILTKIGYELTEFYLDDFKHLHAFVLQTESYINKDLFLYKRIEVSTQFSKLNASEKGELLIFLESLEQVGSSKYAETLPLFQPKQKRGALKPLSKLISNRCINIPIWLAGFVITEKEEKVLSDNFKKYLLDESKLLEKVFCNESFFTEVTAKISTDSIDAFYTYILQLHKTKPANLNLNYNGIPWLYIPKESKFQLPASCYCPNSLLKLSREKYESVRKAIEALSNEVLPHYASLALIQEFRLGCKTSSLVKLITKPASFEVIELNNFLDWMALNGETDFFSQFNITKEGELFTVSKSNNLQQYYSSDKALIKFIDKTAISGKLVLLPKSVYSEDRKKTGLLEGIELLKFLLNNGLAVEAFVPFISQATDISIKKLFIDKLGIIALSSEVIYDKKTNMHKIIELILELGKTDDTIYDRLITRITIDGQVLHKKNITDNVVIEIPAKVNQAKRIYQLKLSKIITSYKDETAALTKVADNFVDIVNKKELKTKVFKASNKNKEEIFKEIRDTKSDFFTPYQTFFLLLYKEFHPAIAIPNKPPDFAKYYSSGNNYNQSNYEKLALEMLNILFENNYDSFSTNFSFIYFVPSYNIDDTDLSIGLEKIPQWVLKWLNDSKSDKKKNFLISSGLNSDNSWVVKMRKGLLENNKELFDKGLVNTENVALLKNTVLWLMEVQAKKRRFVLTKDFLKPLYQKLEKKAIRFNELPVPVLKTFNSDAYKLINQVSGQEYHLINTEWSPYNKEIFQSITNNGKQVIDDTLPLSYRNQLKPITAKCETILNATKLIINSTPYQQPFYLEWAKKAQFPIFIYKGKLLPFKYKYLNLYLKEFEQYKSYKHDNKYYVTEDEAKDIPYSLKGLLEETVFNSLQVAESDYKRKKKKEDNTITLSDEEASALKRLFGDSIPKDYQKDLNLLALIKGLVYLLTEGYEVSEAEENLKQTHNYAQLYPIYPPNCEPTAQNAITVKCRSAKSGLLYLRASTWQELENERTYMYISTGNNSSDYRFCITREEVIKDTKANYQVLRFKATSEPQNIDSILKGSFDTKDIWLIIRVSDRVEYRAIFENIRRTEEKDTIENVNFGDESEY